MYEKRGLADSLPIIIVLILAISAIVLLNYEKAPEVREANVADLGSVDSAPGSYVQRESKDVRITGLATGGEDLGDYGTSALPNCTVSCGGTISTSCQLNQSLTGCTGNGLVINTSDVILDCNGYNISGDYAGSGYGVNINSGLNNVTVRNCTIFGFNQFDEAGIYAYNGTLHSIIENKLYDNGYGIYSIGKGIIDSNTITNNQYVGIYVEFSGSTYFSGTISRNNVSNNNAFTGTKGIYIVTSFSVNVTNNTIASNRIGIEVDNSIGTASKIWHNNIYSNTVNNIKVTTPPFEASYNNEGNYWGRSTCPPFIANIDSNSVDVVDSYPYNSFNGWLTGDPIYCPIDCGGSTACSCKDIVVEDYNLPGNLTCEGDGLTIEADDITIDCNGYSIIGNETDGYGIYADGYSGLSITDCVIHDFVTAVVFDNVSDSAITGGEFGPNNQGSTSQVGGARLHGTNNITISGVYMHNNSYSAIDVWDSNDITIEGNNLNENCGGVSGIFLWKVNRTIIQNNNITNGTGVGILMQEDVIDSQILNNEISHNADNGIYSIDGSSGNTISGNNLFDNGGSAMNLYNCENHNIQNNVIRCTESGTMYHGIYLFLNEGHSYSAENNTFSGNEIYNCNTGLGVYFVDYFSAYGEDYHNNQQGMYLNVVGADENTMPEILESDIHDNEDGIVLAFSYAYIENTDFTNNIKTSSGLDVDSNSVVYLNNGDFINNSLYGITADGDVYWTIEEDVYCTNNDISINSGWIVPLGGKIIADNCAIYVNGSAFNMSGGQTGYYAESFSAGMPDFGSPEYGVSGEIHTLGGYPGGDLVIKFYNENPGGSGFFLEAFGAWIDASLDPAPGANLDWWMLKIYYTDEELAASGLDESKLEIQFYNATSGTWFREANQGVDTVNNYIWANLTHFSIFGIFGTAPSSGGSGGGGGGCIDQCIEDEIVCRDGSMYVCKDTNSDGCTEWAIEYCETGYECENGECVEMPCIEDWICEDWSECADSIQARRCADWNRCGTEERMPATKSDCMPEEAAVGAEEAAAPEEKTEAIEEEKTPAAKEAPAFGASRAIGIAMIIIAALAAVYMMVQHGLKSQKVRKQKKR